MAVQKNKNTTHNKLETKTNQLVPVQHRHHSPERKSLSIVGIGASAGGLEALEQLFIHLPTDSGLAFVIVQHLDPARQFSTPEILSRLTKMPIHVATEGMKVELDSIYFNPPDKDLEIKNGTFVLKDIAKPRALRLPIDLFLRSLAKEKGSDAIGIILSGTGTDGTLGLKAIKAEGGTAFVQDLETARYDGMPRSAIETGLADFVLRPEQMPQKLMDFVKHYAGNGAEISAVSGETQEPMKRIFAILRARVGHDFSCYKQSTVHRRLQRRMNVCSIYDVSDYANFLKDNEAEIKALLKDILIRVTGFFRDPEAFEALRERMKELVKSKSPEENLRVWVAGCATGEEAYSIAMVIVELLDEFAKPVPVQIYATDIDADALNIARAGVYPANIVSDVTAERLKRFFVKDSKSFHVNKKIREMVVFAPHDFIKDPPFSHVDLICCRNLLIYLKSDVQKKLVPLLHYALNPGGLLFLGPAESVGEATDLFSILDKKWKIFKRREAVVSMGRLRSPVPFAPSLREPVFDPSASLTEGRLPEFSEKIFLDNYAATFAVIDEKFRPVYVRGRTGKYLELASGKPSWSILEMAREGLRSELASALYRATSEKKAIVQEGIRIRHNGGFQTINLTVAPLDDYGMPPGLMMVIFQEVGLPTEDAKTKPAAKSRKQTARLEEELRLTKDNLQSRIEAVEATNEELVSANEELQSTNEELDTSREELQSLNEELLTVNSELSTKTEIITKANDDLKNYLSRTDIAIIFLDEDLKIRSYTPATVDVFNIREVDVGRPFIEITSRLTYEGVEDNAREVLRTLQPREVEVQRQDGRWYIMRILPYLTVHNHISGLVMSFLDIDNQKQAEADLRKREERFRVLTENLRSGVALIDEHGEFVTVNSSFLRIFSLSKDSSILNVRNQDWSAWKIYKEDGKTLLQVNEHPVRKAALTGKAVRDETVGMKLPSSEDLTWIIINAEPILKPDGSIQYLMATYYDITERKKAEDALREREREYRSLAENMPDIVTRYDRNLRHIFVNTAASEAAGIPPQAFIGKTNLELGMDPEQVEFWMKHIQNVFATCKPETMEFKWAAPDGLRYQQTIITPEFDSGGSVDTVLCVTHNLTEIKRIEETLRQFGKDLENTNRALKESEEKFSKAFHSSPVGLVLTHLPDGRWIDANDTYLNMLEYTREEVIGHTSDDLKLYPDPNKRAQIFRVVLEKGKIRNYELSLRTKTGRIIETLSSVEKISIQSLLHKPLHTDDFGW